MTAVVDVVRDERLGGVVSGRRASAEVIDVVVTGDDRLGRSSADCSTTDCSGGARRDGDRVVESGSVAGIGGSPIRRRPSGGRRRPPRTGRHHRRHHHRTGRHHRRPPPNRSSPPSALPSCRSRPSWPAPRTVDVVVADHRTGRRRVVTAAEPVVVADAAAAEPVVAADVSDAELVDVADASPRTGRQRRRRRPVSGGSPTSPARIGRRRRCHHHRTGRQRSSSPLPTVVLPTPPPSCRSTSSSSTSPRSSVDTSRRRGWLVIGRPADTTATSHHRRPTTAPADTPSRPDLRRARARSPWWCVRRSRQHERNHRALRRGADRAQAPPTTIAPTPRSRQCVVDASESPPVRTSSPRAPRSWRAQPLRRRTTIVPCCDHHDDLAAARTPSGVKSRRTSHRRRSRAVISNAGRTARRRTPNTARTAVPPTCRGAAVAARPKGASTSVAPTRRRRGYVSRWPGPKRHGVHRFGKRLATVDDVGASTRPQPPHRVHSLRRARAPLSRHQRAQRRPRRVRSGTVGRRDEPRTVAAAISGSGLAAERARRQQRVDALRATGVQPYPYRFDRTHSPPR